MEMMIDIYNNIIDINLWHRSEELLGECLKKDKIPKTTLSKFADLSALPINKNCKDAKLLSKIWQMLTQNSHVCTLSEIGSHVLTPVSNPKFMLSSLAMSIVSFRDSQ